MIEEIDNLTNEIKDSWSLEDCATRNENITLIAFSIYCAVEYFYFVFEVIILALIVLIGMYGNAISIGIFLKRSDWNATCRIYYLAMAIFDLINLIVFGLPIWTGEGWEKISDYKIRFIPESYSIYSCKIFRYLYHVSWFASNWILTAYSFERLLIIYFPFLRMNIISVQNAKRVVLIISSLGAGTFSYIIFTDLFVLRFIYHRTYHYFCLLDDNNYVFSTVHLFISLIFMAMGPPVVLGINNIILLVKLREITQSRLSLIQSRNNINSTEINAAKNLVILACITIGISIHITSWVVAIYSKCKLLSPINLIEIHKASQRNVRIEYFSSENYC